MAQLVEYSVQGQENQPRDVPNPAPTRDNRSKHLETREQERKNSNLLWRMARSGRGVEDFSKEHGTEEARKNKKEKDAEGSKTERRAGKEGRNGLKRKKKSQRIKWENERRR